MLNAFTETFTHNASDRALHSMKDSTTSFHAIPFHRINKDIDFDVFAMKTRAEIG